MLRVVGRQLEKERKGRSRARLRCEDDSNVFQEIMFRGRDGAKGWYMRNLGVKTEKKRQGNKILEPKLMGREFRKDIRWRRHAFIVPKTSIYRHRNTVYLTRVNNALYITEIRMYLTFRPKRGWNLLKHQSRTALRICLLSKIREIIRNPSAREAPLEFTFGLCMLESESNSKLIPWRSCWYKSTLTSTTLFHPLISISTPHRNGYSSGPYWSDPLKLDSYFHQPGEIYLKRLHADQPRRSQLDHYRLGFDELPHPWLHSQIVLQHRRLQTLQVQDPQYEGDQGQRATWIRACVWQVHVGEVPSWG